MALNPRHIVDDIITHATGKSIWLAYSGGVDSHVLLHLLATSDADALTDVHVVHVDHGLHVESIQWAQHCAEISSQLNIDFHCLKAEVVNINTLGLEAAAREARYKAISSLVANNGLLLTAQHQQDQAETLLLQLMRGAGPNGLAAMNKQSSLGKLTILRPLLEVSQQDIENYARQHDLQWIDDPSNVETRWNRNYVRHNIWPLIEQRWPSAAKTICRSAQHCQEASELMTEMAQNDLIGLDVDSNNLSLSVANLLLLSGARQRNVLRYFIESNHFDLPSAAILQEIIDEVCFASLDKDPKITWSNAEVRRFQQRLYLMSPLTQHDATTVFRIDGLNEIILNDNSKLIWQSTLGEGLSPVIKGQTLTVRFRRGGERIKLQNHQHHKTLKQLFQQWQIPTWQRNCIPLIFHDKELIAVVGHAIADAYAAKSGEQGVLPQIKAID